MKTRPMLHGSYSFGSISIPGLLLIVAISFGWGTGASADDMSGANACEKSADKMLTACHADVSDNLFTTIANCLNIADSGARRECRQDARATRAEDLELCGDQQEARKEVCEMVGEGPFDPDPLLDPMITDWVPPGSVANPWFSLVPGTTSVSRTGLDQDEIDVVHVTDIIRDISGRECVIVADVAVEESMDEGEYEYEALEATDDAYAQTSNGDIYYCGEVSRSFEDGILRELDGSFESGIEFAKGGLLIRADPLPGDIDRQEFSLGEAEDIVEYLDSDDPESEPTDDMGGDNPIDGLHCIGFGDDCLKTHEFAALEPDIDGFKFYRRGIGLVLAVDITADDEIDDREVTQCTGDSLDVISEDCGDGIGDAEALLEELCKLSPDAFCADD